MLELNPNQRAVLADKLPDMANIAAGVFIFGQFVGDDVLSTGRLLTGVAIWAFLVGCSLILMRRM